MADNQDVNTLEPNTTGRQTFKVTMEDRKLGYMLVKDWQGTLHKMDLRRGDDYLTLPVPKLTRLRPIRPDDDQEDAKI